MEIQKTNSEEFRIVWVVDVERIFNRTGRKILRR